ncbi:MAG: hypothetical protein ACLQLC_05905 [Candidatus Sulfotelmatobacter sp.]
MVRILAMALLFASLLGYAIFVSAQNPQLETKNGRSFATLVFTHAMGDANASFHSVAIDSTGSVTYESTPRSLGHTGVPYTIEFTASADVRESVFHIIEQLNFLRTPPKDVRHPNALEGNDTLAFREGSTENQATYNTLRNPLLQQITLLFESISTTLEFGRRLTNLHQQHSSELGQALNHMQDLAASGQLKELFVVAPALQVIASDSSEDAALRTKAENILKIAQR